MPGRAIRDEGQSLTFARTAEQVWDRTLAQVPNLFGRLVYLSTLRDPQTVRYFHEGMQSRFGEQQAAQVLLSSHQSVFQEWIAQTMPEQKRVLVDYLHDLPGGDCTTVDAWLSVGFYRSWMPVGMPEPAQAKFLSDSETLLRIIRNESGPAQGHPGSSPLPPPGQ